MTPARIALIAVGVAAIGAGVYLLMPHDTTVPLPGPSTRAPETTAAPAPPTHYAVPEPAVRAPLPRLAESDSTVLDALAELAGRGTVQSLLWPQDVIRRIVVTIDNLPRASVAARLNPAKPPGGRFETQGSEETLAIAPGNAARYSPYVRAFTAMDAPRAVATYVDLYPLFQQAYVELGYPNGYFNDRLVEVIDHLLATPDVPGAPKLAVPHVLYEFADPELESLSWGQKFIVRMGAQNAAAVKAKLREIRAAIVERAPPRP